MIFFFLYVALKLRKHWHITKVVWNRCRITTYATLPHVLNPKLKDPRHSLFLSEEMEQLDIFHWLLKMNKNILISNSNKIRFIFSQLGIL